MPGFSSYDDFLNEATTNGKIFTAEWNKNMLPTTVAIAGESSFLATGAGNPMMASIFNAVSNLVFQPVIETTTITAATAATSGSIAATTFTDTTHGSGFFSVGQVLTGTGVVAGTTITALGTGTGANNGGTYTVNISQTVTSQTITGTAYPSGIPHGGNVSPDYKVLCEGSAFTVAVTVAPCVMYLVDLVGFYRLNTVTTATAQATTNTLSSFATVVASGVNILTTTSAGLNSAINLMPFTRVRFTTTGVLPTGLVAATDYFVIKLTDTTISLASSYANALTGTAIAITNGSGSGINTLQTLLPRYTNGAGLQSIIFNPSAVALGAATPNLSLGYTNSVQASGRGTTGVLPIGKTACPNGQILYSGTGVGKYQPFMPLQGGDAGISQIDTIQNNVSYVSGEYTVALIKPLARYNITTLGVACEKDFFNQLPSCPRIYDGANLAWIIVHGAATPVNSSLMGHFTSAWG